MKTDRFTIKFLPDAVEAKAQKGETVLAAAIDAGIYINSSCGGDGVCGRCKVIINKGNFKTQPSGRISQEEKKKGYVLACLTTVQGDLEVLVPEESRLDFNRLSAQDADLLRLKGVYSQVEEVDAGKPIIDEKVFVHSPFADKSHLGVAFDIGTTTVTGQLVELKTGKILGTKATYNRQAVFGSDVISRIVYASEQGGLEQLHRAVIDNINEIIRELAGENKIKPDDIMAVMVAGNTTMIYLLLKEDPSRIRKAPYNTVANFPVRRAIEAGITVNPHGLLACIPGVSSYVGADTIAGVIACGIADKEELSLLIDIGTNGEMALGNSEWLVCCAASAGPAFEGSGVGCGMRAAKGAIEDISIDRKGLKLDIKVKTIGNEKPKGICGSGYIDALAEMLKAGIIDKNGKIDKRIASARIRTGLDGMELIVAFKNETAVGKDIVITEADIENLKRSKGAIYSACESLVRKVGVNLSDIKKIYVAGGFGVSLDMEKA
ncbi:MAG: ASKHA domain-containing protein, partial [Candidatus Omnitrophica bacterium]|nr:ASKHA domain-containing protein [Candidatus Omnitrophota bacterium]